MRWVGPMYIYIHMIDIQLNTKDMREDVNTCLFLFLLMSTHLFYTYNIWSNQYNSLNRDQFLYGYIYICISRFLFFLVWFICLNIVDTCFALFFYKIMIVQYKMMDCIESFIRHLIIFSQIHLPFIIVNEWIFVLDRLICV